MGVCVWVFFRSSSFFGGALGFLRVAMLEAPDFSLRPYSRANVVS